MLLILMSQRLTAIIIDTKLGSTLVVNVYMPTYYGDAESCEEFTDMCAKITALFRYNDSTYLTDIGDFNCGLHVSTVCLIY